MVDDTNAAPQPGIRDARFGRRQFLVTAAVGAVAVGAAAGLAACGGGGGSGSPQGAGGPTGAPKAGGMLRLGAQGGASTDTLDAQNGLTNTDFNRIYQLFDQLMVLDAKGQPKSSLAKSITPNGDGTEWTIVIPEGVTTHRGKPFTADDVLFSFNRIVNNKYPGSTALGPVDLASSKVANPTTLLMKYQQPFAVLPEMLASVYFMMVPRDFDPKNPDGTGPFMFKDFTPGVSSTFVKNPNYWQSGLPHLEGVVTTNIADETSQVNALQSGQVDVVNFLSQGSVAALQAGGLHVNISKTGGWGPFTMRVDQKPFDDVRVRQAFRLMVNRKEMLGQVFGGQGEVGNDVFSILDTAYPKDLPQREQDIDQAKSLLKAAGADGLSIDLVTTPNAPGMVQAAQVFATQAKKAGVNVNVVQQTTTDYFANSYLKVPFSQDYWQTGTYMFTAGQCQTPTSPFNALTKFNDPEYNSLYAQALAQLDNGKRAELIGKMAHIDYDRGGFIVPYFFPTIDASSTKVGGVTENANGYSPGGNDFANFWLS
jgi:peptide/nickel transport system substrate-binding protein